MQSDEWAPFHACDAAYSDNVTAEQNTALVDPGRTIGIEPHENRRGRTMNKGIQCALDYHLNGIHGNVLPSLCNKRKRSGGGAMGSCPVLKIAAKLTHAKMCKKVELFIQDSGSTLHSYLPVRLVDFFELSLIP